MKRLEIHSCNNHEYRDIDDLDIQGGLINLVAHIQDILNNKFHV